MMPIGNWSESSRTAANYGHYPNRDMIRGVPARFYMYGNSGGLKGIDEQMASGRPRTEVTGNAANRALTGPSPLSTGILHFSGNRGQMDWPVLSMYPQCSVLQTWAIPFLNCRALPKCGRDDEIALLVDVSKFSFLCRTRQAFGD